MSLLFDAYPGHQRINIDGYFASGTRLDGTLISSYYQVYWDGSIEHGSVIPFRLHPFKQEKVKIIHLPWIEEQIVQVVQSTTSLLFQLQVPLPLRLYVSILDATGYQLSIYQRAAPENNTIDRSELFFDPVMLSDWNDNPGTIFHPIFDTLWNAGNYHFSGSYSESGEWKPRIE